MIEQLAAGLRGTTAPARPGRWRGGSFAERTLRGLTAGLEGALDAEDTAHLPGLLQSLDPRAKVLSLMALLLAASLARQLPTLLGLCLAAHALAPMGRLPLGAYLRRVWSFVPLFAGVVALPAVFNFITPGRLVLPLFDLGAPVGWWIFSLPQQVGLSEQGLRAAATLVLRVGTSVALATTLVMTTRWPVLLAALEALRLPRTLVLLLGMTYRYIILLLRAASAMFLARQSRRVGPLPGAEQRRWVAGSAAALLGRSYQMSGEVYLAMLSRGFRGEARPGWQFRWRTRDWLALAATVALAGVALLVDGRI
ncbi:MAG: cobalt ECF transporter T component CbiQ [Chloroflexota bacterium]